MDRNLAGLGAEHGALDAHNVADVILLERGIGVLANVVAPNIDLNVARAVQNMRKARLAHDALGHHASCDADGLAFELVKVGKDVGAVMRLIKRGMTVRILPGCLQI